MNPPKWELAVQVANVMGVRSICVFNDYRERLVNSRLGQGATAAERPRV